MPNQQNSIAETEQRLDGALTNLEQRLVDTLSELVRTPSENLPPLGNEKACQMRIAGWLRELGIEPDVYELSEVPGLTSHPEYWPGRD